MGRWQFFSPSSFLPHKKTTQFLHPTDTFKGEQGTGGKVKNPFIQFHASALGFIIPVIHDLFEHGSATSRTAGQTQYPFPKKGCKHAV